MRLGACDPVGEMKLHQRIINHGTRTIDFVVNRETLDEADFDGRPNSDFSEDIR